MNPNANTRRTRHVPLNRVSLTRTTSNRVSLLPAQPPALNTTNTMNEPFPFEYLPKELQIKIIRGLMHPVVVPEEISRNAGFVVTRERLEVNNFMLTSRDMNYLAGAIRRLTGVVSLTGLTFTIDPLVDTMMVRNMKLPRYRVSRVGPSMQPIPVRKLLTTSKYPMVPDSIDPTSWTSDVADEWTWDIPGFDPTAQWKALPFETALPNLGYLPNVEEMVVSIQNCPHAWHIEGFQQFGPPILGRRDQPMNWWGLLREYDYPTGVNFFQNLGLEADTGIPWRFPLCPHMREKDRMSDPNDIVFNFANHYCKPNIGFLGYSRGNTSMGGKWAGFRYHLQTERVEFRPLTWDEVKEYVHRMYTPPGSAQTTLPDNHHPQFIARVWIIRGEAQPEPEMRWVEVKEWEEGDPDWVEQLATT